MVVIQVTNLRLADGRVSMGVLKISRKSTKGMKIVRGADKLRSSLCHRRFKNQQ